MTVTEITCTHCLGTGTSPTSGEVCHICGGGGIIAPLGTHKLSEVHATETHTLAIDILDKCNDILDKCNDIFEKLNE